MGQLNAGDRPLGVDESGDPRQRFDVLLAPDAHVPGGNPSLGGDGGRLDHDKSDPARGSAAEVDQVPVVGQPVVGAVLAHRRHHDPIAKRDAPDRQRAEQVDFGNFAVVVRPRRTPVDRANRILKSRVCHHFVPLKCGPGASALNVAGVSSFEVNHRPF